MKRFIVFLLFVLFPIGVNALEPNYIIEDLTIESKITEDGSLSVVEKITLTGDFNGFERDLGYKGNYNLYDPKTLKLGRVSDTNKSFESVYSANLGDSYVYTTTDDGKVLYVKMYNYTEGDTKTFQLEYTLNGLVVSHKDVAELYYTFIGSKMDSDITNVKITIELPAVDQTLRAWAHGPLTGTIELKENKKVVATISPLYANNLLDIRMVFSNSLVPLATKISNKDALTTILMEEEERANEANQQRSSALLYMQIASNLMYIWSSLALFIFIYTYFKYDKEKKSEFNLEYFRELPATYGPEVVEYLMKKKITTLSFSATILNIIRKGYLKVEEDSGGKNKEYVLVMNEAKPNEELTEIETFVYNYLLNDLGDGKRLRLNVLKRISHSNSEAQDFVDHYNTWEGMAKMNAVYEDFYENNIKYKVFVFLFITIGIGMIWAFGIYLGLNGLPIILAISLVISLGIYITLFTKRTPRGTEDYSRWKAFKKFLEHFGRFDERILPEIVLWEHFLVYATALGIARKVAKEMKIKIEKMGVDQTLLPNYNMLYLHSTFANTLTHSIGTARAESMSQIASSKTSSGGGFGGGFSGGGGFGGGGTGGGGRGF